MELVILCSLEAMCVCDDFVIYKRHDACLQCGPCASAVCVVSGAYHCASCAPAVCVVSFIIRLSSPCYYSAPNSIKLHTLVM